MKSLVFFIIGIVIGVMAVVLTDRDEAIKPLPQVDWTGWNATWTAA